MVWVAIVFVLGALSDWLTVLWHRKREDGAVAGAVFLSSCLEALSWLPVWLAITWEDWRIVVASVAGSALGTAIGMRRPRTARPGGIKSQSNHSADVGERSLEPTHARPVVDDCRWKRRRVLRPHEP